MCSVCDSYLRQLHLTWYRIGYFLFIDKFELLCNWFRLRLFGYKTVAEDDSISLSQISV